MKPQFVYNDGGRADAGCGLILKKSIQNNNTMKPLEVIISDDFIAIQDDQKEIAGWHKDEWIEDPETVVPAIANAIHLAHTDSEKLINLVSHFS